MGVNKVSVVGLGYIGLPTATMFAGRQVPVVGVDVDQAVVDTLNKGNMHIVEPDLDILVRSVVSEGYFRAVTKPEPADAFLIAVPTPYRQIDGDGTQAKQPDLAYVERASRMIAPVLKAGDLVVLESTSPVGATEQIAEWLAQERPDLTFPHQNGEDSDIRMAHCPERVMPGQIVREIIENDRIIGGMTARCAAEATALYKIFVRGTCTETSVRAAELTKLTENAFRDVNIAFANELSNICEKLDIDVWELIQLANHHPRVNILKPGPGVGGHCIAVDPWFIISRAPDESRLLRSARAVNDGKPSHVVAKIMLSIDEIAAGEKRETSSLRIACMGLTYKANVDDTRASPAIEIVRSLADKTDVAITAVDPHVKELPRELNDTRVGLAHALPVGADETTGSGFDIIVWLVGHDAFDPATVGACQQIDVCGLSA